MLHLFSFLKQNNKTLVNVLYLNEEVKGDVCVSSLYHTVVFIRPEKSIHFLFFSDFASCFSLSGAPSVSCEYTRLQMNLESRNKIIAVPFLVKKKKKGKILKINDRFSPRPRSSPIVFARLRLLAAGIGWTRCLPRPSSGAAEAGV